MGGNGHRGCLKAAFAPAAQQPELRATRYWLGALRQRRAQQLEDCTKPCDILRSALLWKSLCLCRAEGGNKLLWVLDSCLRAGSVTAERAADIASYLADLDAACASSCATVCGAWAMCIRMY
jgi:hypothetical protein